MKIAEFYAALGFKVDDAGLKSFKQNLKEGVKEVGKVALALIGAAYAVDRFIAGSVEAANAMALFNQQTGLSIEKLQEWQAATQLSNIGATAEQVTASVRALQDQLVQIRLGQGNARPFQLLGIDVKGDAFTVLEQVRKRIKGLDRSTATNLIQEMGIDPALIPALRMTRQEFERLSAGFVRSKENVAVLNDLGQTVNAFKMRLALLRDELVVKLAPAIKVGAEWFFRIARAVANAVEAVVKLTEVLGPFISAALLPLLPLLGRIAFAFAPITTIIAGIILILDDFMTYMRGGKSVIGVLVEVFREIGEAIQKYVRDPVNAWMDEMLEKAQRLVAPFKALLGITGTAKENMDGLFGVDGTPGSFGRSIAMNGILPIAGMTNYFSNNFTITTKGDAKETARIVTDTLQNQFNNTMDEFNNGVKH